MENVKGTEATLDESVISQLRELDETGGLLAELVGLFLDDVPVRLDNLEKAAATENADGIGLESHTLKSSAANMGAVRMSQKCAAVEAMARDGDVAGAAALAAEIRREFDVVREELSALL